VIKIKIRTAHRRKPPPALVSLGVILTARKIIMGHPLIKPVDKMAATMVAVTTMTITVMAAGAMITVAITEVVAVMAAKTVAAAVTVAAKTVAAVVTVAGEVEVAKNNLSQILT
jgi:hypothetical protein